MAAAQKLKSLLLAATAARARGDAGAAEALLRRAIIVDPGAAAAHNALGEALADQGRTKQAEPHLRRAIEINAESGRAWRNLANLLARLRSREHDAWEAFENAIALEPGHAPTLYNCAMFLGRTGQPARSREMLERAVAADPDHLRSLIALDYQRRKACDWTAHDELQQNILRLIRSERSPQVRPFALLSTKATPEDLCAVTRRYAATLPVSPSQMLKPHRPDPGRPIRIGYLSRDFFQHATSALIVETLEKHDRGRFEIWGIDYSRDDGSPLRKRVLAAFDRIIPIRKQSDQEAAQAIRRAEIDILVDLKGLTKHARTKILAYRPAPIQVNFLGYPGSVGADFVDYIVADRIVAPLEHQHLYSEQIVHLPNCYQPNDSRRAVAPTPSRSEFGLPEGAFVFCSFNNSYKINPAMFDVWMRLLTALPYAVLWLYEKNPEVAANLRIEAEARGVRSDRIIFAERRPMAEHIARYALADLFLDNIPVNAHTTASEAIWAGLPVLTCLGSVFVGRVCASILHAAGVPELITASLPEYEARALSLARERDELARIRATLQATRLTMPLFDTERFTAGLEDAYLQMWRLWADGQTPRHIKATDHRVRPAVSRKRSKPASPMVTGAGDVEAGEPMVMYLPH